MSYDVTLRYADGRPALVDPHEEGGTYVLGGTPAAALNVTYNYAPIFAASWPERIDGSMVLNQMLDGRRAGDVEHHLAAAVEDLGTERDDDYWARTRGNAGHALNILLRWARLHPDAVFEVC